jgi:hypothetical protein
MQIDIPFDAALILAKTTLREDFPETYARYEAQSTVYVGRRMMRARVKTRVGGIDLHIIRDYFDLWLNAQDLIPEECRSAEDVELVRSAREAVHVLTRVINEVGRIDDDRRLASDSV